MIDDFPPEFEGVPASVLLQVDAVCDRFERAWQSGERPSLEEYLSGTPEPGRSVLFRGLLELELEYRRRGGEQPTAEEYRTRFPGDAVSLLAVFPELLAQALADTADPNDPPELAHPPGQVTLANAALPGAPPRPALQLDDYELFEELGAGGMGVVFRARQRSIPRVVALKMIRPDKLHALGPARRREWLERFRREVRAAARLEHVNILPIYDVGTSDGTPYYAMRYVAGESLADLARRRLPTGRQAAEYLEPVARAVHAAHEKDIVHRDLKPGNILVERGGRPFVVDFGLARWVEEDAELTQFGDCLGTAPYMSPEQALDPTQASARSDVYSLGATLYELLTGRPPFRAAKLSETLRQVIHRDAVAPRRINPAVDRDLETITLKCLRKEPQRRYASAAELADDLGRYLRHEPIKARPLSLRERLARWVRRNPAVATLSGLLTVAVLLVLAAGVAIGVQQSRALAESRRNEARSLRDAGLLHCEKGDVALGLLHLARALELASPEDADLQRTIRLNLSCWARQSALLAGPPVRCEASIGGFVTSPDGARVLVGVGTVGQVINLNDGALALQLRGHTKLITAVAWSGDGECLLTGSEDGTVRVWGSADGAPRGLFEHGSKVTAIASVPGSNKFATTGTDGCARLWKLTEPGPTNLLKGHVGRVLALAIHPQGKTLVTGGTDATVRHWSLESGSELHTCRGHAGWVSSLAFSPDGRFFVSGSNDQTGICWDAATGAQLTTLRHAGFVNAVAISADSQTVLTGGSAKYAQLWHAKTGRPLALPMPHSGTVSAVAFNPDGQTLVTADTSQTIRSCRTPARADLGVYLAHDAGWVSSLAFSPDNTLLATGNGWNIDSQLGGQACLWQLPKGERRPHPYRDGYGVRTVAFSPNNLTLVAGHSDGIARMWDIKTGKRRGRNLEHSGWLSAVSFSPDGRYVLSSCLKSSAGIPDAAAFLWDARDGRLVHCLPHGLSVNVAAFHPSEQQVLTAGEDGIARLWDVRTGALIAGLDHGAAISAASFNHDGSRIVTAGADRAGRVWNVSTREQLWQLPHQDVVHTAVFSPNGAFVLTAGADQKARVWDAATGLPWGQSLVHVAMVDVADFSPDGRTILTGSRDNVARFWDRDTGTPLGPKLTHTWGRDEEMVPGAVAESPPIWNRRGVVAAGFSPDGNWCATGSIDGTTRLWAAPISLEGEATRVMLWIQTGVGQELDAQCIPRDLSKTTWLGRYERLARLGGPPLP